MSNIKVYYGPKDTAWTQYHAVGKPRLRKTRRGYTVKFTSVGQKCVDYYPLNVRVEVKG